MKTLTDYTDTIRRNLFVLLGLLLSAYFSYHMIFGERSYTRLSQLDDSRAQATIELSEVGLNRKELEADVVMLRPGSIDSDLLEERARVVLGLRYKDEHSLL